MSKLVFLVVVLALFHLGQAAINCYNCNKEGCKTDQKTWSKTQCGQNAGGNTPACLKHVFKDAGGMEQTIRKCILIPKGQSEKDYKCNAQEGTEITCAVCTTDLCNSAPGVTFSYFALAGVLAAYLIPKYLVQ